MGVQVPFDYAAWVNTFPMFASLPESTVAGPILMLAESYCRNDGGGPVTTAANQTNLLNLMVAHIAQLGWGANGDAPSGLVGIIKSAAEGSVNVSVEFPATPASAWYNQTQWGAMFWAATASYRTMRYVPGRTYRGNSAPGGGIRGRTML